MVTDVVSRFEIWWRVRGKITPNVIPLGEAPAESLDNPTCCALILHSYNL